MIEGRYAQWTAGIPFCPECKGNQFNVAYKEVIEYPISSTHVDEFSDNFYLHKHVTTDMGPIQYLVCSECYTDIVVDNKIRQFFANKEEYSS